MLRLAKLTKNAPKVFASAYITRHPLVQSQKSDLTTLYHNLQQNLQHQKSIKSDFEIAPNLDWELANQRELKNLENLAESENISKSKNDGNSEHSDAKIYNKLHFITNPTEWDSNSGETILDLAKRSVTDNENKNVSDLFKFINWPSSAPIAVDIGENDERIFYVPCFLEVNFDDLGEVEFGEWSEETRFAV